MKTVLLVLSAFIFSVSYCSAQSHRIEVKLDNLKDSVIYLAHYYGFKIIVTDSATLDNNGRCVFEGEKPLKQGLYIMYKDANNYLEFLVGKDQVFSVKAALNNGSKPPLFTGAKETEAFQNYKHFFSGQKKKQAKLQNRIRASSSNQDSVKIIRKQMEELNNKMLEYWETESEGHPGTFYGDFMKSMIMAPVPEFDIPAGCTNPDSMKWVLGYNFRKGHYWDNFNFSRGALLRTPLIESLLNDYMDKVLIQIPDSMVQPLITLIEKSKANDELFSYMAGMILTRSANSNVMGMDKVFVEIANKYFLSGEAHWVDSINMAKIAREAYLSMPNLIGVQAHELKLPDENEIYHSLHQVEAKITVLYFYESNCNHCAEVTPVLYDDIFMPLKDKGVEVYAVYTQDNKKEWKEFIFDNRLFEWINVWDPHNESGFRMWYNIKSTPMIYILDEDKTIIAKGLDVNNVKGFIEHTLKKGNHK